MLAQTYMQLYRQLKVSGYHTPDLKLVHGSHELASQIFSGCYRPTRKPFICHLVGTASTLVRHGERAEVIAAGILHSAYPLGDFGDGSRGATEAKRRVVTEWVGAATERLVHDYATTDWSSLEAPGDGPNAGNAIARELMVVKLADIYEDFSDGSMSVAPAKNITLDVSRDARSRERVLGLASTVVNESLADEFRALWQQLDAEDIDDFLVSERRSSFFEQRKPLSRRMHPVRRWLSRLR